MWDTLQHQGRRLLERLRGEPPLPPLPRPASHSGLTCLVLVAYHHGMELDERQLAHEYALDEHEPPLRRLAEMAGDHGLRHRTVRLNWDKALALQEVCPVLCQKRDGSYFLLAGVREGEDGTQELAVIDPTANEADTTEQQGIHRFWPRAAFEQYAASEALLLKKRYKLTDEQQPFSLYWFVPEFIKLKGLFGQFALAVLVMTLLSLLMRLFFQIVIDKVLPKTESLEYRVES